MEPGVLDWIVSFIQQGGTPAEVIELLSSNFRGLCGMCGLVADWLEQANVPTGQLHQLAERYFVSRMLSDFDPRKADTVFNVHSSSAPQWLDSMINEPGTRRLLYALKSRFKDGSLLVNFVIQRIAEARIYHDELATQPHTVASYLSVFRPVFLHCLSKHVAHADACGYHESYPAFARLCLQNETTVLFSLSLLRSLHHRSTTCARLFDDLLADLLVRCQAAYRTVVRIFVLARREFFEHPRLQSLLKRILLSSPSKASAAMEAMVEHLRSAAAPPPYELLQNVVLFDSLINTALTDACEKTVASAVSLLALVVVGADTDGSECSQTLLKVVGICRALLSDGFCRLGSREVGFMRKSLRKYAVVGALLVRWAELVLLDPNFFMQTFYTENLRAILLLLREILWFNPPLRRKLFGLLARTFGSTPPHLDSEALIALKCQILDLLLYLAALNFALPVLELIETSTKETDQSLIRYFLFELTTIVAPPYSSAFVSPILRTLSQTRTFEGVKMMLADDFSKRRKLVDFLNEIDGTILQPLEARCLQELKASFCASETKKRLR